MTTRLALTLSMWLSGSGRRLPIRSMLRADNSAASDDLGVTEVFNHTSKSRQRLCGERRR